MEALKSSPFGKLKRKKYQILEVLQFSGFMPQAIKWLHGMNQETRAFLANNYLMIKRGYEVEGFNILIMNFDRGENVFQSYLSF
jgi:hypothetical protein